MRSASREHKEHTLRARALRRASTEAERLAWELLRDRSLLGLRFKRNVPYDRFFLDFYCPALRLCIELDGGIHDAPEQAAYDLERTRLLEAIGIRVVRLRNEHLGPESLAALVTPFLPASAHETHRPRTGGALALETSPPGPQGGGRETSPPWPPSPRTRRGGNETSEPSAGGEVLSTARGETR